MPPSQLAPCSPAPPRAQASPLLLAAMRTLLPQGPLIVRVSKLHTPEVLIGRNELDPHVPPVRASHSLPDDVSVHSTARGQVRHTQSLLQFNFLWRYQQAAVGVHYPGNRWFLNRGPPGPIQLYLPRPARVHSRTATFLAHPDISWQVLGKRHPD